jgi:hypothetical protein
MYMGSPMTKRLKKNRMENLARDAYQRKILRPCPSNLNLPAHRVVQNKSIWLNMSLSAVRVLSTNSSGGSGIGVVGSAIAAFEYSWARKNCGSNRVMTTERAVRDNKLKKAK